MLSIVFVWYEGKFLCFSLIFLGGFDLFWDESFNVLWVFVVVGGSG